MELWKGWKFINNVIVDNAGNIYTQNDIKMSWLAMELVTENMGSKNNIKILSRELKNKIAKTRSLPKVCLVWETEGSILESVYSLNE